MHATLVVTTGDDAGRRVPVPAGAPVRVGRTAPADAVFAADSMMSNLHFSVECDEETATVRDLGSRFGTLLNGGKVTAAPVRTGDEIKAGRTTFAVELLGAPGEVAASNGMPPAAAAEPVPVPVPVLAKPAAAPEPARVVALLRGQPGRLYAVLDAAREPTVPDRLAAAKAEYASLYDGEQGREIEQFGPWLVSLPPRHALLDELAAEGWGHSWGIYLCSDAALADVRRHLRKFLLAKLPDGRQVYFRYYDPRVLRTYLPTCTAGEMSAFFGPVKRIVVESPDPGEALTFAASVSEWAKSSLAPAGAAG